MISVSCLKLVCCETDVCFLRVFGFNGGLIHNFVHQAFSIQWAFFLFPAVALFFLVLLWLCYSVVVQYRFVVAIYQLLDIGHAAIAEFQSVPVKYFPQFVVCRKRSIDEADERSSDVGFDVFVIRRVEPYNHI